MDGYEWVLPDDDADFEVLVLEDSAVSAWPTPAVHLLRSDEGQSLRRADMPWSGRHALVLRDDAVEEVGNLLWEFGDLLRLSSGEARLTIFAARAVAGALDTGASDIVRFDSGEVMDLRRPVFHPTIAGAGAFRLSEFRRGALYLTQDLVDAIRETGLSSGTDFKLVYESPS